jgi:hypothetical protein
LIQKILLALNKTWERRTPIGQRIVATCISILSDLIKNGILSHLLISKILNKKYPNIIKTLLTNDADLVLQKAYITFIAMARYELEEFDLEKGRYYTNFNSPDLSEEN